MSLAKVLGVLALAILLISMIGGARSAQTPSSGGTPICDCKPEFNTTAEGPGTCHVAKDDTRWCKIKFNGGTGAGTARQDEFKVTLKKYGLPSYDNVTAAQLVNTVPPDRWNASFVETTIPPLIAVALWDAAPERMSTVTKLISTKGRTQLLLKGLQLPPPRTQATDIGPYKATVSWGCIEMVDQEFSITIKTYYSTATRGCTYR